MRRRILHVLPAAVLAAMLLGAWELYIDSGSTSSSTTPSLVSISSGGGSKERVRVSQRDQARIEIGRPGWARHLDERGDQTRRSRAWSPDERYQTAVLEALCPRPNEAWSGQGHLPQPLVLELNRVGGRPEAHHVLRRRSRVRRCSTTPNRSATSAERAAPESC